MALRMPEQEEGDIDIQAALAYRKLSRCRPPFVYRAEPSLFPEVDQQRLFDWEFEVFHGIEAFPRPPREGTSSGLQAMHLFHERIEKAKRTMENGINAIKNYDFKHEPCVVELEDAKKDFRSRISRAWGQGLAAVKEGIMLVTQRNWFQDEKERWGQHYHQKKDYFDQCRAYLMFCKDHHPDPEERQKARELLRKVEMAFVGHQGIPFARSAGHEIAAFRRSGEASITHPYAVGIEEINFWMGKLDTTEHDEERDALFENMIVDMVIAFFHDTLEDHYLNAIDLRQKITEAFNLDGRVLSLLRAFDKDVKKLPENLNIADKNMPRILRALKALREPENPAEKTGYIPRQIHDLPPAERARVLIIKIHDRLHNLKTLKYMKTKSQTKKITETVEIIDFALQIANEQSEWHDDLIRKAKRLTEVCMEELRRIREDPSPEYGVERQTVGFSALSALEATFRAKMALLERLSHEVPTRL